MNQQLASNPPKVLVVSRIVLDRIFPAPGAAGTTVLGGSGFWAAFGARLVLDDVAVTCKVGPDFHDFIPVMEDLGIRRDGLVSVPRTTSRTDVTYSAGEVRHEEPIPSWDHHCSMRTVSDEFPLSVRQADSYYVFRDFHPGFWSGFESLKDGAAPLLWEIPGSVCSPGFKSDVESVLRLTTILSINRDEATALTGRQDILSALVYLHNMGARVVAMTLGASGSVISDGRQYVYVKPPANLTVNDVTGGGNAFSGAFLAAFKAHGGDIVKAGMSATAAASVAISQIGAPRSLSDAVTMKDRYIKTIRVFERNMYYP